MDITREETVFGLVSDVLMAILLTSVDCFSPIVRFVAKWGRSSC